MRPSLIALLLCIGLSSDPGAQLQVKTYPGVFAGMPVTKISESGDDRVVVDKLDSATSQKYPCYISQRGSAFIWESRDGKELRRTESGAYITFAAIDGSGYVRIVKPDMKAAAALVSPTAQKYDYVEHLLIGLASVTYYGVNR